MLYFPILIFLSFKTISHHGASVVGGGDGPESLLASSVPDLKFDLLTLYLHRSNLEVDPCAEVYTINVIACYRGSYTDM